MSAPADRWTDSLSALLAGIDAGELAGDDLVSLDALSYAEGAASRGLPEFEQVQLDPGLDPFLDEIVEPRAPILGDDLRFVERGWTLSGHGWRLGDWHPILQGIGLSEACMRQRGVDRRFRRGRRLGHWRPQLGSKAAPDP